MCRDKRRKAHQREGKAVVCAQGAVPALPPAHVFCLRGFSSVVVPSSTDRRELYRHAIVVTEDTIGDDNTGRIRKSSFSSMLRKGSTCNIADDSLIVECPVERQIRYFVDFCPSLEPSLQLNVRTLLPLEG